MLLLVKTGEKCTNFMLSVFVGKNEEGRKEIEKKLDSARKKGKTAVIVSDATFSEELVSSYFGANDLFGEEYFIFLDRIFMHSSGKDFFWKELTSFISSSNEFLLSEEKILADDIRVIEKKGGDVKVFKTTASKQKPEFNVFSLGDAFGMKNKKELWVLYEKAIRHGETPEALSGILFWQVKNMLLVLKGGGETLNPFIRSKASRFVKNFSKEELEKISFELVSGYHKSRRSGLPLQERVEKLILSM